METTMKEMPSCETDAEPTHNLAPAASLLEREDFSAVEQRLAAKFGIHSEFVRVPALSKMLSLSANAIYTQMHRGTFPLPHKKLGNVVVVRFHDFVNWYCFGWHEPSDAGHRAIAPHEENAAVLANVDFGINSSDCLPSAFTLGDDDGSFERYKKSVIARIKSKRKP
jgi:predicted DNA-binding transcriptional regulator AlpA